MTLRRPLNVTAICIGVLCFALGVAMVFVYLNYNFLLQNRDLEISLLKNQLAEKTSQVDNLNGQVLSLNEAVNLKKAEYWLVSETVNQPANSFSSWNFTAKYAGYLWVNVQSSTSTETYIQVNYSAYGVTYINRVNVGSHGSSTFPILPSQIQIIVGNSNLINGATEVVTATYYG